MSTWICSPGDGGPTPRKDKNHETEDALFGLQKPWTHSVRALVRALACPYHNLKKGDKVLILDHEVTDSENAFDVHLVLEGHTTSRRATPSALTARDLFGEPWIRVSVLEQGSTSSKRMRSSALGPSLREGARSIPGTGAAGVSLEFLRAALRWQVCHTHTPCCVRLTPRVLQPVGGGAR